MTTHVRFPLQTGASALRELTIGATLLGVAALTQWIAFATIRGSTLVPTISGVVGVYCVGYSFVRVRRAWQRRASDLVVGPGAIVIEGGVRDGRSLLWNEIEAERTEIIVSDEDLRTTGPVEPIHRLVLGLRGGDSLLLAEGKTADEQASLEALLASLKSPRWRTTAATTTAPSASASAILACPSCGAPAAPADAAEIACTFCRARVLVPAELRERIRASNALGGARTKLTALVREVMKQPRASRVNEGSALVASAVAIALVAAIVVASRALLVATAGVLLCGLSLVLGWVADRHAFRAILGAGAIEPARSGDPHLCRRCHGPLPVAGATQLVVGCVFCNAENVLGLDLRREHHEAAAAHADLATALDRRRARRRDRWLILAAGLVLVSIGVAGWLAFFYDIIP